MNTRLALRNLVWLAGALQMCQIPAMLFAPKILHWKDDLSRLQPINRAIIAVIAIAIVIVGVGTGIVVMLGASDMLSGTILGKAFCAFLGFFWLYRATVQIFVYSRIWPSGPLGRASHHGLTLLFVFQAATYLSAFVFLVTRPR